MEISEHIDKLSGLKAKQNWLGEQRDNIVSGLHKERSNLKLSEKARETVVNVLLMTQEQVKEFIETTVSLALSLVYGDDYSFELEYSVKRNQSEVVPWIVIDGERFSPKTDVGGGVVDVSSFALRLAIFSLMEPKPRNIFILDEPARFLSRDKQPLFGAMLKEVSTMLGVQIIMVSHSKDIIDYADKAYEVEQDNGISKVRLIEEMK